MGYEQKVIPKPMENYVMDSYRFLSSGLDKLVKSINSLPILDSNNFEDELFKKKLFYP